MELQLKTLFFNNAIEECLPNFTKYILLGLML